MSNFQSINRSALINKILSKTGVKLKPQTVIITEDVDHIPFKDIIEIYLFLCGNFSFSWNDFEDKSRAKSSLSESIFNLIINVLSWPFRIVRQNTLLRTLKNNDITVTLHNEGGNVCYLRTDHWFNLKSGGSVGHVSGVINALHKLSYGLNIFSTSHLAELNPGISPEIVPPNYRYTRNIPELPDLAYNSNLYEFIATKYQKNDFKFIYQRYSLGNYVGILLKRKFEIPLVCEFNGSLVWVAEQWGSGRMLHKKLVSKIERINLEHADLIVVVSEVLKKQLLDNGIPSSKILVNPNGVDEDKYHPHVTNVNIKEKYNLNEKVVFGFIGTFGHWHGVVELAKAIVIFFDTHPNYLDKVKFLLIGSGRLWEEVVNIINDSGYEKNVVFTGRVPQNQGMNYLAACDIFLSPHVPNPDGTPFFGSPTKLFEYMAMGRPIIASNLDQIGEILTHNETAFLVEPGNIEELAQSFDVLIKDDKLRSRLAKNAHQLVLKEYTWVKHVEKILTELKN